MTHSNQDVDRRLALIGFFSLLCAVWSAVALTVLRLGMETGLAGILVSILFLVATLFFPFCLPKKKRFELYQKPFFLIVSFFAWVLSPLLTFVVGKSVLVFYGFFSFVGLLRGLACIRRLSFSDALVLLIIPPLIVLHLLGPQQIQLIYFPEAGPVGLGDGFNFFYAAMTAMVQKFGVASLGVLGPRGIESVHYHIGSLYWFGALARLSETRADLMHPIAHFVASIPLLFGVFLGSVSLNSKSKWSDWEMICGGALLVLLGNYFSSAVKSNSFVMTSLTLSLSLFILGLGAFNTIGSSLRNLKFRKWFFFVGLFLVATTAIVKISTGMILGLVFFLHIFKKEQISKFSISLFGSLLFLFLFLGKVFSPNQFVLSGSLLKDSFFQLFNLETAFVYFFPFGVCFLLYLRPQWIREGGSLSVRFELISFRTFIKELFQKGDLLPAQALLVSLIVGVLAGIALKVGSNAVYFVLPVTWMSYFFICSESLDLQRHLLYRFFLWGLLPVLPIVAWVNLSDLKREIQTYKNEMLTRVGEPVVEQPGRLLRERTAFPKHFYKAWENNAWVKIIQEIRERDQAVYKEGGRLAVYFPNSNRTFWDDLRVHHPYECLIFQTYVQSLTGVSVFLDSGFEDFRRKFVDLGVWFDFDCESRKDQKRPALGPDEICPLVEAGGITDVLQVNSSQGLLETVSFQCQILNKKVNKK